MIINDDDIENEIIEALFYYYEGTGCEEYLVATLVDIYPTLHSHYATNMIEDYFEENMYCLECGSKLEVYEYDDYHSEVGCSESFCEWYCPNPDCECGGNN